MCGIAAIVGFGSPDILPGKNREQFAAPLRFRGPDDKGEWHHQSGDWNASLFHTRLSIIDLQSTGHQPMISVSRKTAIVFNGEIYNYQRLRQELVNDGFSFFSQSDTEVLLNGFEHWGLEKLLGKIDGMFAFLLYDISAQAVYIARDRFGKKPLYYSVHQNSLIVSSDIRSYYQIPSLSRSLDLHSLGYFFYEFSTPREQTIWTEIKKLPAGHYGVFSKSGLALHEYWRLSHTESNTLTWGETIEHTEALLREAIKKRLVGDVSVAAQLSGGLDSSLIVALMASLSGKPVKTYNVTFNDATLDESQYARLVAKIFTTDHTEVNVSDMDVAIMDSIIGEFGEPFADTSMLPTYQVCKEISRSEKVVCGGDGGDEIFGGYFINHFTNKLDIVKKFHRVNFLSKKILKSIPSYRTNFLNGLLEAANQPAFELLHRNMSFNRQEMETIFQDNTIGGALAREHQKIWTMFGHVSKSYSINLLSAFLHTRLENAYLAKVDRASMYASLEMRSPFLDKNLVEFAATLTRKDLFSTAGTKSVLKAIAEKYFPKDFVHRHKKGFGVPLEKWLRGEMGSHFKEVVFGGRQNLVSFNYPYVENIFAKHLHGENHTEKLWPVYVFHRWAQQLGA